MRPRRLRVSHLITRLNLGGAQENTVASVNGLSGYPDLDVSLIAGPTRGPEGSMESRIAPAVDFRIAGDLIRPVAPANDLRATFQILRAFRSIRPDIVHTHSAKAGILGRFAAALSGTPLVIHSIHGPTFGNFQSSQLNLVYKLIEWTAGLATNHYISVADEMSKRHLSAGIGRPEQYSRIYSGFDLSPYLELIPEPTNRERFGLREGDFVIGKIARMFELKGHDDLFDVAPEICARIPNARFLLVGGGEWEERFRRRAEVLGLKDRFVFTGLIPPESIPETLSTMNALAHLSYREGLPRVLAQALAAARPVVAYDCDGARELCKTNITGELIRPGAGPALVRAFARIAEDPQRARAMGQTGREFVRTRFNVATLVEEQYQLYHWALRRYGLIESA